MGTGCVDNFQLASFVLGAAVVGSIWLCWVARRDLADFGQWAANIIFR